MEVHDLKLPGVKLLRLKSYPDARGSFSENYSQPLYEANGISVDFVQDNLSISKKGTIRGMHFQSEPGQAKLIRVVLGTIYDVYVDIRPDSPTFGKWGAYLLKDHLHEQLFIPVGYAHGFAALSETAYVLYKVSTVFNPKTEKTFYYNDPEVGIEWPIDQPILSEKDRQAPRLREVVQSENLDFRH